MKLKEHLQILAPAKINLCLDVLKKTSSGYHEIQTVFALVPELCDEIEIATIKSPLTKAQDLVSIIAAKNLPHRKFLPKPKENLVYKAVQLLRETISKKNFSHKIFPVKITIHKNIPPSSGLGGASSDAAAILKGLNRFWDLGLSTQKLLGLGKKLGADVPFFLMATPNNPSRKAIRKFALGTHFGEKIKILSVSPRKNRALNSLKIIIDPFSKWPKLPAKINLKQKTRALYASLDLKKCCKNTAQTKQFLPHNDFAQFYKITPGHHLSGSGPATFTAR